MTSPKFVSSLVLLVMALLGYFIVDRFIMLQPNVAMAIGILLGGLVVLAFFTFIPGTASIPEHVEEGGAAIEKQTLYVGNLPYKVSEDDVRDYFSAHTRVYSVRLMRDRKTGKRKGYGFVEVASDQTDSVINKLNDTDFEQRTLKVRLARQKTAE